jgi:sarcosine/dimethylglycine N-methyltransferase
MSNKIEEKCQQAAQAHYNHDSSDKFYRQVWAGKDVYIGIGWYEDQQDTIFDACQRMVSKMAAMLSRDELETRVLELGAGYGATARYLARKHQFLVDCLNLSQTQNQRNRQLNQEQGLDQYIRVIDGCFENIPYEAESYDVVWSQDAFLHSNQRQKVMDEVNRVLKRGGDFIFTDLMQRQDCPYDVIKPVLDRFQLESLASFEFYQEMAHQMGWKELQVLDLSSHLVVHYVRLRQEVENRYEELLSEFSQEHLEKMKKGISNWIAAGKNGDFKWGLLHFQK